MAVNTNALCSLDDVKNYLGIEGIDDAKDELIEELINNVTEFAESYCDRNFYTAEYTEYHNGDGTGVLFPKEYPITSVSGVWDDTDRNFTIGTNDFASDEYGIMHERWIELYEDYFTKYTRNVKIIYTAGYSTIPLDLKQAGVELVAWKFNEGRELHLLGIDSVSREGTGATAYYVRDIPAGARMVLDRYRRRAIA